MNITLKRNIFNDVYFPYLQDYSNKIEVYYGGSGSGKSYFIAQKILLKALQSKRTILVVRKYLNSQLRSCWKLILDTLEQWHIYDKCKINLSNYEIQLPNKSIIYIAGIDNPERIKSIVGITDIWCEECTELTLDDFTQLILRMRAMVDNSQIYCSFNPISKANWVYKRWFSDNPEDTTALIIKTTYKDNKFLPASYIESLEQMITTNPTYYKIYALGEFATLDKTIYNNYRIQDIDSKQIKDTVHCGGTLCCGLDFGFVNDMTAFIASIVDEDNKTIYIYDEWCDTGKTNRDIYNALNSLGYSKSNIIADSAEPKSIEELKRLGLYRIKASVKGKDSILAGIQKIQQYKLIVSPKCTNTITELENYAWKKDKATNEYINEPIDQFNHCLDALRYSIQITGKTHLTTMSKNKLGL